MRPLYRSLGMWRRPGTMPTTALHDVLDSIRLRHHNEKCIAPSTLPLPPLSSVFLSVQCTSYKSYNMTGLTTVVCLHLSRLSLTCLSLSPTDHTVICKQHNLSRPPIAKIKNRLRANPCCNSTSISWPRPCYSHPKIIQYSRTSPCCHATLKHIPHCPSSHISLSLPTSSHTTPQFFPYTLIVHDFCYYVDVLMKLPIHTHKANAIYTPRKKTNSKIL